MEKCINKHGREHWKGVDEKSEFSSDLFHYPEYQGTHGFNVAFHSELGSLTVCERLTGYLEIVIESGFRAVDGEFWLASGGFDVRKSGASTVGEAIKWVKDNANTFIGKECK